MLAGGGAQMKGLPERLDWELNQRLNSVGRVG